MTKTTREKEQQYNQNVLISSIFICLFLIIGILAIYHGIFIQPKFNEVKCDIGREDLAGDFKINTNDYFLSRDCAIKDCAAFNKIHESIDGYDGMRCVV